MVGVPFGHWRFFDRLLFQWGSGGPAVPTTAEANSFESATVGVEGLGTPMAKLRLRLRQLNRATPLRRTEVFSREGVDEYYSLGGAFGTIEAEDIFGNGGHTLIITPIRGQTQPRFSANQSLTTRVPESPSL